MSESFYGRLAMRKPGLSRGTCLFLLVAILPFVRAESDSVVVIEKGGGFAMIHNERIAVRFDLANGTWGAVSYPDGRELIKGANIQVNNFSSTSPGTINSFIKEPLADALGIGSSLLITSELPHGPKLLLRISLYPQANFIALTGGIENTTPETIQVKTIAPLINGTAFPGANADSNFSTLDGFGGGIKTFVDHKSSMRSSLNNLLVNFGEPGQMKSLVMGGLGYVEFEKRAEVVRSGKNLTIKILATDPIGKRVDPGTRYLVTGDRFYVDALTDNPFDTLETYADKLRLSQDIVLPVCRFPIVDTWCAQVPHFGGGEDRAGYRARNDSVGAVEEMEAVVRSGFLRYSPVAVMLEPDLYDRNNQQGWWDDAHWQRGPNNRIKNAESWKSSNGQFVPPYETVRAWAGAIKSMGGIPMIYMQTGFRSQDYAETFPQHMIFNEANASDLDSKGEQTYRDKEKKYPRMLGYDYTDPGFIGHMREVWENLRLAGVQGVKFDYPDYPFTGWPTRGGLENPYATTAMHYRNVFELAKDGLGPDAFIHERTLSRGSDISLGLVTSQRTEGDTDHIDKMMISRNALRWYKNRVVVVYDMDAKNPFHAVPANRDGQRAMLTMTYVVAGTLMIAPSFGRMPTDMLYDLSRLYPYHSERRSARPLDMFGSDCPHVYDFAVNPRWHQLTFYNSDTSNEASIGVDLSGDTANGTLGLDATKDYYVYDFWNNAFVARLSGHQHLEQKLRAGEARMMSIHQVEDNPQVISTDRHLMQGLVDLRQCSWDSDKKTLRGISIVPAGEPYRVIIAGNSRIPQSATIDDSIEASLRTSIYGKEGGVTTSCVFREIPGSPGFIELTLTRSATGPVAWSIVFDGK